MTACVYANDGNVFARYARPNVSANCPAPNTATGTQFANGVLMVSRPILLDDRRLGTPVLIYDLAQIKERIQLYGFTVTVVFFVATMIAFLLSARLRSLITTPIIEPARVTSQVSTNRDYSMRSKKFSEDELGLLVDVFNDMADVGRLNADLRTSNEHLARSNEDLERFAFIASHDLQEPLRMITIYSQLLVRNYVGDEKSAGYVVHIENGTRHMRELLADLLAYAEIGARLDEPAQPVDLDSVLAQSTENLAFAIAENDAVINATGLPVICGFESHFIPLFQNLIGNAIKYRSEMPPKIDVVASRVNGYIQIRVQDNGMGIAEEYHSKIFVAFKRLHGKRIPGTGVGLAICQRIIERYGGRIWVESQLGRGSSFIFTLPADLLSKTSNQSDN